jgi:hypothetical protein
MPFKMKGFPAMKGTGAMKAMKESAMKKMHASPKKAMKDPMKKMKDPMKAMKDPMKAMHASPKKRMKGGMKSDPDYYKKGNFMDTKKSEQERIDKKAYGPEGAPATVKPKKGRDTLTTAIPQSTIGKKLKDKAKKAMSPKKKMTDDKDKLKSKIKRGEFTTTRKTPIGGGEKYAELMKRMREAAKEKRKKGEQQQKGKKVYVGGQPFGVSPKKAMSPKKKLKADPPETQAKIKKMIISGIEKGKDDRDIMKKINSMSSGNVEYTYNRNTKKVKVRKKGASGFEGELETDPDKG